MKNFLHYMQKEHKFQMKWLLFWGCGLLMMLLNGDLPSKMSENAATDLHLIVAGTIDDIGRGFDKG